MKNPREAKGRRDSSMASRTAKPAAFGGPEARDTYLISSAHGSGSEELGTAGEQPRSIQLLAKSHGQLSANPLLK